MSYARLSTVYPVLVSSMILIQFQSLLDAMLNPGWHAIMENEMHTLEQNKTWELVLLLVGKKAVRYRWIYTVKLNCYGTLAHLKAYLIEKGYSWTKGVDY